MFGDAVNVAARLTAFRHRRTDFHLGADCRRAVAGCCARGPATRIRTTVRGKEQDIAMFELTWAESGGGAYGHVASRARLLRRRSS